MTRGWFVAIEALDGVGKTTLVGALAARLGALVMNTPGDALRPLSRAILGGLGDDQSARALFYAATVLAQGRRARAITATGRHVVMDRYWLSTLSYARARGVDLDLSSIESAVPRPDLTVLLTLDEAERRRRLGARTVLSDADRESLAPAFRDRVLAEMTDARRPDRLRPIVVDVTGADETTAAERVLAALGASRWTTASRPATGRASR